MPDDYLTAAEFAALPADAHHAVWAAVELGRVRFTPYSNVRCYHRDDVAALLAVTEAAR